MSEDSDLRWKKTVVAEIRALRKETSEAIGKLGCLVNLLFVVTFLMSASMAWAFFVFLFGAR